MRKLVVLDYESGEVHIYNIDEIYLSHTDIVNLINNLGHNEVETEWMITEHEIICH